MAKIPALTRKGAYKPKPTVELAKYTDGQLNGAGQSYKRTKRLGMESFSDMGM